MGLFFMISLRLMTIAILIILGLCFGSFINALVWRLHEQSKAKKKRVVADKDLSIMFGRSMCTHCKHQLAWYDLLPVISWLSMGGKCRYCRKPIGWQYPLVEILTAVLFVTSYLFWPHQLATTTYQLSFALWLASLVMLIALCIYDIRWMLLPNKIVFPLIGVATLYALIQLAGSEKLLIDVTLLIGSIFIASGIFYILFQLSAGRWIGGGDVKLGLALGLLLGTPVQSFIMLFVASLLGLVISLPAIMARTDKRTAQIPFGPFLISATIIVMLWGGHIADWYLQTFLYV